MMNISMMKLFLIFAFQDRPPVCEAVYDPKRK